MKSGHRRRCVDSKWSWLVCFSAHIAIALIFGFALSFGVYQPVLMEYFNENKETTSRAGSITIGLMLFSGPFAVFLTDRFGHRLVAIACGFICSLSLTISSFVSHIMVLYLSYSVLFGFTGGILLNTCITITKMYFKKSWPLAAGIVSSGSNTGMLIVTQATELLIESFGWRTSFRVMSGFMVFISIAAFVFKPIHNQHSHENENEVKSQSDCRLAKSSARFTPSVSDEEVLFVIEGTHLNLKERNKIAFEEQKKSIAEQQLSQKPNSQQLEQSNEMALNKEDVNSMQDANDSITREQQPLIKGSMDELQRESRSEPTLDLEESIIVIQDGTGNGKEQQLHIKNTGLQHSNETSIKLREEVFLGQHKDGRSESDESVKRKMMFKDFCSLFNDMTYVVGLIATVIAYFGLYAPHIHLVQFGKDLGISSRQSAQFYIYFSISNIVTRIIIGPIVNKLKLLPFIALQLSALVSGLAVIFLSFAKTYIHFVVFGLIFGIGNGGFITLHVLFFMSIVSPEKSGLSLGVMHMISSLAVISGPPFAGYLADKLGSYVTSFLVIGGIIIFGSLFPLILCLRRLPIRGKNRT